MRRRHEEIKEIEILKSYKNMCLACSVGVKVWKKIKKEGEASP